MPRTDISKQFQAYSKFGDTKSDGSHISLSQSDKWMKQAKVIDGKTITAIDTGIHFKKFKSLKITYQDYIKFIEDLAKTKKLDPGDLEKKLAACEPESAHITAGAKADAAVDRLTDTSKYTGAHKQRFDESGKGKGIVGREDLKENTGYVSGYRGSKGSNN